MEDKRVNGLNGKDAKSEFLSWYTERNVTQTVKLQIELLSNHVVKTVKNKEERRNRYWLLMSLAHLIACNGCGENMSFEAGYAYIYNHIQEERLRFIYQCGARHVLSEEVLTLVTWAHCAVF